MITTTALSPNSAKAKPHVYPNLFNTVQAPPSLNPWHDDSTSFEPGARQEMIQAKFIGGSFQRTLARV